MPNLVWSVWHYNRVFSVPAVVTKIQHYPGIPPYHFIWRIIRYGTFNMVVVFLSCLHHGFYGLYIIVITSIFGCPCTKCFAQGHGHAVTEDQTPLG